MPYQWNAERERKMLLLAISSANLRPSADTWKCVAAILGDGLTASAVSQKYYKLRKESDAQAGTPPATPKKRKASEDDDEEEKKKLITPSKRARGAPRDPIIDGVPFSDASDSPKDFKAEEMAASVLGSFQSHQAQYTPAAFYPVVNMDGQLYGEFNGHGSGQSSFIG